MAADKLHYITLRSAPFKPLDKLFCQTWQRLMSNFLMIIQIPDGTGLKSWPRVWSSAVYEELQVITLQFMVLKKSFLFGFLFRLLLTKTSVGLYYLVLRFGTGKWRTINKPQGWSRAVSATSLICESIIIVICIIFIITSWPDRRVTSHAGKSGTRCSATRSLVAASKTVFGWSSSGSQDVQSATAAAAATWDEPDATVSCCSIFPGSFAWWWSISDPEQCLCGTDERTTNEKRSSIVWRGV